MPVVLDLARSCSAESKHDRTAVVRHCGEGRNPVDSHIEALNDASKLLSRRGVLLPEQD